MRRPQPLFQRKWGAFATRDYRFCWLRDTTFSLLGMLHCGFEEDARAWLQWLSRSSGDPKTLKVAYGITGKREHSEWQASWLSGYRGSRPSLSATRLRINCSWTSLARSWTLCF